MSVRDTSRAAYGSIVPELSERQAAVLGCLQRSRTPLTNSEIGRELGWEINRVTPRTNELVKLGAVKEMGKRECKVTGRTAHTWGAGAKPKPKLVPEVVIVNGERKVRWFEASV